MPEAELKVTQQKREFAEREYRAQKWLNEDIIAVTKWIKANQDTIAVTHFENVSKQILLKDTIRANEMLKEALQELLNDEVMARETLQHAKETTI